MNDEPTITFKLDPKTPQTDWSQFDALTDEEKHTAALADSDALPLTDAQLSTARRISSSKARLMDV